MGGAKNAYVEKKKITQQRGDIVSSQIQVPSLQAMHLLEWLTK